MPDDDAQQLSLTNLQTWFQSVVTHPAGVVAGAASAAPAASIEAVALPSLSQSPQERLEVYAHAYWARLLECLREEFPVLRTAVGDDAFDSFAVGYLQAHPSQSYTLARLADRFAEYLATTMADASDAAMASDAPTAADRFGRFVVELAGFEHAINVVFDLAGGETLGFLRPDDLQAIPVAERGALRLAMLPTMRLFSFDYDVNGYFTAARSSAAAVPDLAPRRTYAALSRRDYIVRRTPLTAAQFTLLTSLRSGRTLNEALAELLTAQLELPADTREPLDGPTLEQWFTNWTAAGFFTLLPPGEGAFVHEGG